MAFRILGLAVEPFLPLFDLTDSELKAQGARREIATTDVPGYPCRVSLEEAAPGERLLLVNFEHQKSHSPYRSSHAIYVREVARRRFDALNAVPALMRTRILSVRAFDLDGIMRDADIVDGPHLESLIEKQLAEKANAYLHVHFAKRGCYAARVERP